MIDIEKFICSLLADHPVGVTVREDIHKALKDQGLEYKGGKIVPIEDKTTLKESEEQEIRKSIIGFLKTIASLKDGKTVSNKDFDTKAIIEWVAWLEKQGEKGTKGNEREIPNSAWSGEDESIYQSIIDDTVQENQLDDKQINWLKSLKDRYSWKPSGEQIRVCKKVYADILSAVGFNLGTVNSELNRLEEELKKLKE